MPIYDPETTPLAFAYGYLARKSQPVAANVALNSQAAGRNLSRDPGLARIRGGAVGDAKLARGNFKGTFGKYSSRLRTKGEQEQQERRKSSPDQSDLVNESRKEEGGEEVIIHR